MALLLLAGAMAAIPGCGDDGLARSDAFDQQDTTGLDLGDDWAAADGATARRVGLADTGGPAPWAIMLKTFVHDDHERAAANMVQSCATIDPRLGGAYVHTTAKGSKVVYGSFTGPDDAKAQDALAWIKSVQLQGRPVFPRALLVPLRSDRASSASPYDLAKVRAQYPNVRPLYTLSVALWGDFESGKVPWGEIVREAEQYCRTLRAQGIDAYVYLDEARMLGEVTVGLFGADAIDPASQIMSPEVELLRRQFPNRLVNGETLTEMINARLPSMGTRLQSTRLVLVP